MTLFTCKSYAWICWLFSLGFTLALVGGWTWPLHASQATEASPTSAAPAATIDSPKLPLEDLGQEALENEKRRQEIFKLRSEIKNEQAWWTPVVRLAPLITALVGLTGAFIAFLKYLQAREQDRLQRESDARQRLDENFATVTANLGATSDPSRAAAAAALVTFSQGKYPELYDQLFLLLLANLRVEHPKYVKRMLVCAFENSLRRESERRQADGTEAAGERPGLDLAGCYLARIDLRGIDLSRFQPLDLHRTNLAYANLTGAYLRRAKGFGVILKSAHLSGANLEEARLRKANLAGAYLENARLVSTKMDNANLRGVKLQGALLQGARFNGANLEGAHFEGANISDAYFLSKETETQLDDTALRSLGLAKKLENAHFDSGVKEIIDATREKKQPWRKE